MYIYTQNKIYIYTHGCREAGHAHTHRGVSLVLALARLPLCILCPSKCQPLFPRDLSGDVGAVDLPLELGVSDRSGRLLALLAAPNLPLSGGRTGGRFPLSPGRRPGRGRTYGEGQGAQCERVFVAFVVRGRCGRRRAGGSVSSHDRLATGVSHVREVQVGSR